MSESFVLSSIFIAIIILTGFVGMSFGIGRGFVVTAAILLGSEIALWWGDNLGRRIDSVLGISPETGRFLGGVFLLLVAIQSIGIVGSTMLRWGAPTRWGAFLGAILGAANGALLIGIVLRLYYMTYAGKLISLPLDHAMVTRVLWRHFDWFLLGFFVIASVSLLATRFMKLAIAIPDPVLRGTTMRPIPPPIPKTPSRMPDSDLTSPMMEMKRSSNGHDCIRQSDAVDDKVYAPPRHSPETEWQTEHTQAGKTTARAHQSDLPSGRHTIRFCPNCGMTLDASDRFCPDCGFTL